MHYAIHYVPEETCKRQLAFPLPFVGAPSGLCCWDPSLACCRDVNAQICFPLHNPGLRLLRNTLCVKASESGSSGDSATGQFQYLQNESACCPGLRACKVPDFLQPQPAGPRRRTPPHTHLLQLGKPSDKMSQRLALRSTFIQRTHYFYFPRGEKIHRSP